MENIETTLLFFSYYLTLLFSGSFFICGWYAVTRGEWVPKIDDTWQWNGKLFSPWLRFWEGARGNKKVYFKGQDLQKLLIEIEGKINFKGRYDLIEEFGYIKLNQDNYDFFFKNKHYAELSHLNFSSIIKKDIGSYIVFFYREEEVYLFPEWVRSPLATCIYCHGSFYGTIVWWVSYFAFHPFSFWLILLFWVPYMISLSFLAPFFYKKG